MLNLKEGTPMTKKLALAAVAAALLSTTALAQSNPPAGSTAPAAKPMGQATIQSTAQGKWRTSKLIGVNVYNASNEKIGDINELITDSSGKIDVVVVGVGGFVGIGEHNVGIPFGQVKWVNQPVTSTSTTSNSNTARTVGSGAATTTSNANKDYPDHAVVSMTKDQLKALPAYKYASDTPATRATVPANPQAR